MSTFTCESFTTLDREIIDDFYDCFIETTEEIENCCSRLNQSPSNELVHELFRSMHSLKGNCRMVFLDPLVTVCHQLEEIVAEIRDQKYDYQPEYGEFMTAVISRIDQLIRQLIQSDEADSQLLYTIEDYIKQVYQSETSQKTTLVNQLLNQLAGVTEPSPPAAELEAPSPAAKPEPPSSSQQDLEFFLSLAVKMDNIHLYKRERIAQVLQICRNINKELGNIVDDSQLCAAVYLHDIGMAFLPNALREKETGLSREEVAQKQDHVRTGAQLLHRMPGWEEAATIIQQHHEKYDGQGYPKGLKGDQIHPGAMILSVVDTYQYVINHHSDTNFRKTLLRAVTEINSNSESHFDPRAVEAFNLVVRQMYVAK